MARQFRQAKAAAIPAMLRVIVPGASALLALAIATAVAARAQSAEPVAIVEEVSSQNAGVQEMDYVAAGRVIRLAKDDTLVVSYMRACLRESIRGGVVTIGQERSKIQGGDVKRETFTCDAGRLRLTAAQASASGAMAFRGAGVTAPPATAAASQSEITIYARAPVIDGIGPGELVFARMDKPADHLSINVSPGMLKRGTLDLQPLGVSLEPGGRYEVKTGARRLSFTVASGTTRVGGPLLSRLLRL